MYVEKDDLVAMIEELQRTGRMTPELVAVLRRIILGLVNRYRYKLQVEDAVQEYCLLVMVKAGNIDTTRNIFNYLTTCARNVLRSYGRNKVREEKLMKRVGERVRA